MTACTVELDGQAIAVTGRIARLVRYLVLQREPLTRPKSLQLQIDMQGPDVDVRVTTFCGRLPAEG
jgi:hypothetical protein